MSLYDYQLSKEIEQQDYPFYAILMAVFRQADSDNLNKLREAFPEVGIEFVRRYNAPYGLLPEELQVKDGETTGE